MDKNIESSDNLESYIYGRKACSSMQTFCYGLGHIYNDLCAAMWFSYTLFYFQIVLQMESTTAGTLIMIGQVADSVATPAVGWASDWTGSPQAWHLTGSGAVAVGFTLMFSFNPGANHWWSILYYCALVILFQIGWAAVQISHLSVITRISKSNEHSADLTAIRYTASVCCSIFVYIITWSILKNDEITKIGPDDFYKFKEIVLIITGLGILCSVTFYCGIDSNKADFGWMTTIDSTITNVVQNGFHRDEENSLIGKKSFLKSPVTYQVSLMYMSSRLYTTLNLIYIPLYLDERLSQLKEGTEDTIRGTVATVPLLCYIASFLTSVLFKNRPRFLTDKMIYSFGIMVSLIGCIWIAVGISSDSDSQVYVVACLIGVGGSATMIASLCLTANFVNNNGFQGGSVYSTVTFTDKLISGAVVLLIQDLKCDTQSTCPHFYEDVIAYATGTAAILGLFSLITLQCNNPNMTHQ